MPARARRGGLGLGLGLGGRRGGGVPFYGYLADGDDSATMSSPSGFSVAADAVLDMEAWVRPSGAIAGRIALTWGSPSGGRNPFLGTEAATGKWLYGMDPTVGASRVVSDVTAVTGVWAHLRQTIDRDTKTVTLWVNGVKDEVSGPAVLAAVVFQSSLIFIGTNATSNQFWVGDIVLPRFYSAIRSDAEAAADMVNPFVTCATLISGWHDAGPQVIEDETAEGNDLENGSTGGIDANDLKIRIYRSVGPGGPA